MRWLGRAAVAVLLAAMAATLFAPVPHADAHAALIRSSPDNNATLRRAPTRVILYFSEPVEQRLTKVEVIDAQQQRVDKNDIAFDAGDPTLASVGLKVLQPGLYFVRWSNVSRVDGHALEGQYPFIVLNADGSLPAGVSLDATGGAQTSGTGLLPRNLDVGLKWIATLALAAVAGAGMFVLLVSRPSGAFLDDDQCRQTEEAVDGYVAGVSHVLLPASFIAGAVLLLLTVQRFNTPTSLFDYVFDVRVGQYRGVSLGLLLVGLACADVLFLSRSRRARTLAVAGMTLASVAAIYMYAAVSHAATGAGQFWSIGSDFLHFAASGVWLGALIMLPLILRWSARGLDERSRWLYLANVLDRFSVLAGLSVAVVLSTGTFNAFVEIPEWDALWNTTYGRVLLAKLALVGLLLPVAAINAFYLKPRLVHAIDESYQSGRAAPSREPSRIRTLMLRTIAAEVVLVIAVFAAVAVLSQTSTAKGETAADQATAAASRFKQDVSAGDLRLTLGISPNRVGINDYVLDVQREDGTPVETITQARLRFTYDGPVSVPRSELILTPFEAGEFRGSGAYFTQEGNWRAEIGLRRSDGDDVSRTVVLGVRPARATANVQSGGLFELPFDSVTWNEVAGVAFILAGVLAFIYRRQLGWTPRPVFRTAMTVAAAAIVAGGVLAFGVDTHQVSGNPTAGNPVAPTDESVQAGRMLFQQNCIVCHGQDGRGDGPAAAQLDPSPTDFRQHMPLHTDPQFYAFIARGYPGSAMPAFQGTLSESDIWNLVNFLRAAFTEVSTQ